MEKRRIVKSGSFSYTVVIPKEWIERHKLTKGMHVFMEETEKGLILLPTREKSKNEDDQKEHLINVDNLEYNSVVRDIVASYLTNKKLIRLHGKTLKKNILDYKKTISKLSGLEVIEETSDYIFAKDFINIEELVLADLMRRADNILRSLFEDTIECIQKNDSDLAKTIQHRDQEINRLSYLIYKGLNFISEHPQKGVSIGVPPHIIHHIWELNSFIEKTGDEIKRVAITMINGKISPSENKVIIPLLADIQEFYIQVMTSIYKSDLKRADGASDKRHSIHERCNKYLTESKSSNGKLMVNRFIYVISYINSISRIARYITIENHQIVKGPLFVR